MSKPFKRTLLNGLLDISKRPRIEDDLDGYALDFAPSHELSQWQATITKVIKSVVSIQFTNITNFDTEVCLTSEATGFVVDAERGIILTNRHVVGPGPFSGYAVFDNHEEAVVSPIYRDPIHDFGFLRFDPKEIQHMAVTALDLRPDLAKVGTEIRVVGNDAGEKLSILAGFISRLDRNAPYYGAMTYNDFNTEYIQAAASASGGSSGLPVVDENGYAVALQAGGSTEASTDFFLPVSRPLRALQCVQQGLPITRGDVQVEWMLRPYEECRRLGLTPGAEAHARKLFPDKSGMLVAELVLPEGPADGQIKEGDTLVSINGVHIATFIQADEVLDECVGQELEFVIQRGGRELKQRIKVGDLHAITPHRYVEVAGALFNDLSYQMARCCCIPVRGVHINDASGTFDISTQDKSGWLLDKVDGHETPNLDAFIAVLKTIPDRQKVTITFRHLSDLHMKNVSVVYMERHWQLEFRLATRNDETGLWDFTTLQDKPLPPAAAEPLRPRFVDIPLPEEYKECAAYLRMFVQVRTISPIPVDCHPFRKDAGYGVVIDASHGYVLVLRKLVPHDVVDIYLLFAELVDVSAQVVFLHPTLNYAIVKYDPLLIEADVGTPTLSSKPLKRGDESFFVGYNYHFRIVTDVVNVGSVSLLNVSANPSNPRYRGINLECVLLDSKVAQECDTGVLVDKDGTLRAFWLTYLGEQGQERAGELSYRMGLDVTDVADVLQQLRQGEIPAHLRILDTEFTALTVFSARTRGVPQSWITRFENECEDEVKFLSVYRLSAPRSADEKSPLQTADIVLTVNGRAVKSARDLSPMYTNTRLTFQVVRQREVVELEVPTIDTSLLATLHVLFWCGLLIQEPHHAVRQLMEKVPSPVYVARKSPGGPMTQYGIQLGVFITHVNDTEVTDFAAFIGMVKAIADKTYVKLRLVSFDHVPGAVSMKTNYHYYPTLELKKDNGVWTQIES